MYAVPINLYNSRHYVIPSRYFRGRTYRVLFLKLGATFFVSAPTFFADIESSRSMSHEQHLVGFTGRHSIETLTEAYSPKRSL